MTDTDNDSNNRDDCSRSHALTGFGFPESCGVYFAMYGGFPVILDVSEESAKVVYADGETDPIYNDTPPDWWMDTSSLQNSEVRRERNELP
jgi:hypothetical protein